MRKRMTMRERDDISLREGFEKFISDRNLFGVTERTIKDYKNNYRYFTEYLDESTMCSEISEDTYNGYIEHINTEKPHLSKISINTYLTNVRAILYFLMDKGYIKSFPCKLIKAPKPIKKTYTLEEMETLFVEPDKNACTFCDYRNWALICYFIATGNRANTVVNIKIKDVDFRNNEVVLTEVKNKKQDIAPMSPALKKSCKNFWK